MVMKGDYPMGNYEIPFIYRLPDLNQGFLDEFLAASYYLRQVCQRFVQLLVLRGCFQIPTRFQLYLQIINIDLRKKSYIISR